MSYDLTIKSDDSYSESTDLSELRSFIERLPHIVSNGETGFCYSEGERYYIKIDLEVVSEEGDTIEDEPDSPKDRVTSPLLWSITPNSCCAGAGDAGGLLTPRLHGGPVNTVVRLALLKVG